LIRLLTDETIGTSDSRPRRSTGSSESPLDARAAAQKHATNEHR